MGCNQSTLKGAKPAVAAAPAAAPRAAKSVSFVTAEAPVAAPTISAPIEPIATTAAATIVPVEPVVTEQPAAVAAPAIVETEVVQAECPVATPAVVAANETTFEAPAVEATPAAQVEAVVPTPSSPPRAAFGVRSTNEGSPIKEQTSTPVPSFGDFLAAQEVARTADENAAVPKRKVVFDSETMRRSAPRTVAPSPATLSKKQKELVRKGHVSQGRRGPVAPKGSKGAMAQMQAEKYLEMAAAFERLLTNAATINAHLDTR